MDSVSLTGFLHLTKKKNLGLFFFMENAGHVESRGHKYKFLLDAGYPLFLVEYRGYGGNSGSPTESSLIQDSSEALKWLIKITI